MSETNESGTSSTMTLQQVRESILGYVAQGNAGHFHIGRLYNHTVENKLAEKEGFDSAQQFFSQQIKALSQAMLSRCGTVAREFTEQACGKYGVSNLSALLTYAKQVDLRPDSNDPGATPIDVPEEGGGVVRKPFTECTVEELRRATKHKRNPTRATMPPPDATRVQLMRDALARHFSQGGNVRFNAHYQRGKTLLSLQNVPLEAVERLAEALLEGLQPVRAVS
jgi:hypothetical protein